jgi:hypothetical protein
MEQHSIKVPSQPIRTIYMTSCGNFVLNDISLPRKLTLKHLSTMRERRGLRAFKGAKSETFKLLFENKSPIVIPVCFHFEFSNLVVFQ